MRAGLAGILLAFAVAAVFGVTPLSAHHDDFWGVSRDPIVLKGKLVRLEFRNPHCSLLVNVKGQGEETQQWFLQMGPPHLLSPLGWRADSLKAGDEIVVTVFPDKLTNNRGVLKEVEFAGKKLQGQPG